MQGTQQKPKILSSSVVAKSKIFEIQAVDLEFSNGEQRTFERFTPGKRSAVLVVALQQDQLLLINEYAVGTERYELGFAKGLMDRAKRRNKVPIANCKRRLVSKRAS